MVTSHCVKLFCYIFDLVLLSSKSCLAFYACIKLYWSCAPNVGQLIREDNSIYSYCWLLMHSICCCLIHRVHLRNITRKVNRTLLNLIYQCHSILIDYFASILCLKHELFCHFGVFLYSNYDHKSLWLHQFARIILVLE